MALRLEKQIFPLRFRGRLSLVLLLAPISAAADPQCTPSEIKKDLKIVCEEAQQTVQLTYACEAAKANHVSAGGVAEQAYQKVCELAEKLKAVAQQCSQQKNAQQCVSRTTNAQKQELSKAILELKQRLEEAQKAQEALLGEKNTGVMGAIPESTASAMYRNAHWAGMNKADVTKLKIEAGKFPTKPGENVDPSTINGFSSQLMKAQLNTYAQITESQRQIAAEIAKLEQQYKALEELAAQTKGRGERIGPPSNDPPGKNDQNKSDVTGGDNKSPGGGSSPQQQGGGSGGGSPSGGQPSSVTDPNHPGGTVNPATDSQSPGSQQADGKDKAKEDQKGGAPGNGIIDISKLKDPKKVAGITNGPPRESAGTPLDSQMAPSSPAGKQVSTSAHASAVGGGGVSAGGTSSPGLKGDGKGDGSGASSPGGGGNDGGIGSGGGGGGSRGGGGSDSGSQEALSPFGKPLGDSKFSLAGSETDASVKNIVGVFNNDDDANRDLAGETTDGIGERDSVELWDRVHAYHQHCQQKGCVTGLQKRKVGGG